MVYLWVPEKRVLWAAYCMPAYWVLALLTLLLFRPGEAQFIFFWMFMTFNALFGGFSVFMTLHLRPQARERHPRLERTVLILLGVGVIMMWFGIFLHVAQLP